MKRIFTLENFWVLLLVVCAIALLFLMATRGNGQTRSITAGPYVASGSNVGLTSVIAGGQATVTAPVNSTLTLTADGFWLPYYPKHGSGSAYGFEARGRIYVKRAFGMVGLQRTTAKFDGSGRTSTHPLLGGGYTVRQATVEAYYAFPDRTRYHLQKVGARMDFTQPLGRGKWILALRPGVEFFWYGFQGATERGVKPNVSVQVGRRF